MFCHFFHQRQNVFGQPLTRLFCFPQYTQQQWARIPWLPFGGEDVEQQFHQAGWVRAWHGTKTEALHSVAYFGRLVERRHQSKGERLFDGAPRVCLHKDATRRKAEHYIRFVQLVPGGFFYTVKWEVRTLRTAAIKVKHATDQWVLSSDSVKLVALWVCARNAIQMRLSD